jgi:hypothetical protein
MLTETKRGCFEATSGTRRGQCTRMFRLCTACPTRIRYRTSRNWHFQSSNRGKPRPRNAFVRPRRRLGKHRRYTHPPARRWCRKCRRLPVCNLRRRHRRLGWSSDRCIFVDSSQGGRRSLQRTVRGYTPDCFRKRQTRHRRRSSRRSDGGRIGNRCSLLRTGLFPQDRSGCIDQGSRPHLQRRRERRHRSCRDPWRDRCSGRYTPPIGGRRSDCPRTHRRMRPRMHRRMHRRMHSLVRPRMHQWMHRRMHSLVRPRMRPARWAGWCLGQPRCLYLVLYPSVHQRSLRLSCRRRCCRHKRCY